MIVQFTARSAAAFWQMVCQPGSQWKDQKFWYRGEDPTAEVELARLHQFADKKLCSTKKVTTTDPKTGAKSDGEIKSFNDGAFSLRKDLVVRLEKVVDHYRKICAAGSGGILPIQFAELTAGLKGNKPVFDDSFEDPEDVEELAKLQAEQEQAKEDAAEAAAELKASAKE